jgi:hypothetical protein
LVFIFSDTPPSEKKIFMFLEVNAQLTPLGYVIGMYLPFGLNYPACYLWSVQQVLASHWLD